MAAFAGEMYDNALKKRTVMMPTLSSLFMLLAPKIIGTTTRAAASDDEVGIMTTLGCQGCRCSAMKPRVTEWQ